MALIDLANPTRFLALTARVLPFLAAATVSTFACGLYLVFATAPDDYQMGAVVKIMFIHVPNAWLAMGVWAVMCIASIGTLVWRHPLADVAAKAAAPLGAAFTFLALFTGSLWGRPMWGTYWVWDARLTSVLVLFLMYLGVIALWRTVDDPARAAAPPRSSRWSAPSICRSSSSRSTGGTRCISRPRCCASAGPRSIRRSSRRCWCMALGFLLLFVTLHLATMRNEILRRRVRAMWLMQAHAAQGA
jgi:heme exporter protein C